MTKVTRASMKALSPGKSISDGGVVFTRMADGSGRFSINCMVDGKRIHRVIGRDVDGTTLTHARDALAALRTDASRDRLDLPTGRKLAMRFDKAAAAYIERLTESGGKNIKEKTRQLRLHLVPFFGDKPIDSIVTFDVDRYRAHRRTQVSLRGGNRRGAGFDGVAAAHEDATPVSDATINREVAALSHMLNCAQEWGWVQHRPAKMRRTKETGGRIVYLSADQVKRVIACAREDTNPQILPFILIGLSSAMRAGEILSIRREHVGVDKARIFIPKAKAGMREQPITRDVADFLAGYMQTLRPGDEWLFPSPASKSGHTVDIRTSYKRVIHAAGLDPSEIVRHTLRHTAITFAVQAGVDLPTVQRIAGHSSIQVTSRYAHANGAHIERAMDKLSKRLKIA
ncbi:tyrosine-type recombinase/integrase [Cupriavidus campinensis]